MNALPQKVSAVTPLDGALDGTEKKKRKTRSDKGSRRPSVELNHVKVDDRVMVAAKRIIAQGTYTNLVIVDAETVIVR